jgi:RNA 2',3'-cyclic 3'-phosphodiesterase
VSPRSVRCFVAVLLPDRVRAGLAAVCAELRGQTRGVAWVRSDNLHLTLRFLGEIDTVALEQVREAVVAAAAGVEPFAVTLRGLGGFPPGRPPRVLWAGLAAGSASLEALYARLEAALIARGIPGESRAFHPHVTLARTRASRGEADLTRVLGNGPALGEVRVAALHLMRSELDPRGARYGIEVEAPLGERSGAGR